MTSIQVTIPPGMVRVLHPTQNVVRDVTVRKVGIQIQKILIMHTVQNLKMKEVSLMMENYIGTSIKGFIRTSVLIARESYGIERCTRSSGTHITIGRPFAWLNPRQRNLLTWTN